MNRKWQRFVAKKSDVKPCFKKNRRDRNIIDYNRKLDWSKRFAR